MIFNSSFPIEEKTAYVDLILAMHSIFDARPNQDQL